MKKYAFLIRNIYLILIEFIVLLSDLVLKTNMLHLGTRIKVLLIVSRYSFQKRDLIIVNFNRKKVLFISDRYFFKKEIVSNSLQYNNYYLFLVVSSYS